VRNHNPNQLRLPFNKEELAAAFLVGIFRKVEPQAVTVNAGDIHASAWASVSASASPAASGIFAFLVR
jgi:hypothetical protein